MVKHMRMVEIQKRRRARRKVARTLSKQGYSLRDIGMVLRVSYECVRQLLLSPSLRPRPVRNGVQGRRPPMGACPPARGDTHNKLYI